MSSAPRVLWEDGNEGRDMHLTRGVLHFGLKGVDTDVLSLRCW